MHACVAGRESKPMKPCLGQTCQTPLFKLLQPWRYVARLSSLSGHLSPLNGIVIWDPPPLQAHLQSPSPRLPSCSPHERLHRPSPLVLTCKGPYFPHTSGEPYSPPWPPRVPTPLLLCPCVHLKNLCPNVNSTAANGTGHALELSVR